MTKDQMLIRLRAAVEKEESQAAYAKRHDLSAQYLGDVLAGRREPGPKILASLGLKEVVTYALDRTGEPGG